MGRWLGFLRLAVSSAKNTRLEHAPPSGVLTSGLSSPAGVVCFESQTSWMVYLSVKAAGRLAEVTGAWFFHSRSPRI
jgi:hypothetical protein